ncbi:TPA: phage tail termination protein [Yersinia enterocolitica]|nr:hypothetical protein [Yersinia enterocolitica]EKN4875884.1 hypothetical protein [Yersinia enterocolitica]ELW8171177.1 hypothetical protein [Yersinia enterocolitica]ELW8204321.1 hypothetical protein [Yersinia enterocolitica]EME3612164.1 hypothetical protein [Yersinia enterocolitica]
MASKLGSSFSGSSGLPRKLIGFKKWPQVVFGCPSGSEYYVLVDVIGAVNEDEAADNAAQAIIAHVQANPNPNDCIGYIENLGSISSPVTTTEGRLVYRLQFAIKYGD